MNFIDAHGVEILGLRREGRRRPHGAALAARQDAHGRGGQRLHEVLVDRHEGLGLADQLARQAVDDEQHADLAGFARRGNDLAVFVDCVEQDDGRAGVIVPGVVRHLLVPPAQLAGAAVDGDDGVGIGVVALAAGAVQIRIGIAGGEQDQIVLHIDGGGVPHRAAAILPAVAAPALAAGLIGRRRRIEAPHQLAGIGVQRFEESARRPLGAGIAHQDQPVIGDGRHGEGIEISRLGQGVGMLGLPDLFAGARIQRHDMTVELGGIHLAVGDRDAARLLAAAQVGIAQLGRIGPQLLAGDGVISLDIVIAGFQIEHAVHLDRRHLRGLGDAGLDQCGGAKLADIGRVDVGEGREALIVIGAAMHDPVIGMIGVQHHRIGDIDLLRDRLHLEGAGIGGRCAIGDRIDPGGGCAAAHGRGRFTETADRRRRLCGLAQRAAAKARCRQQSDRGFPHDELRTRVTA